MKHVVTVGLLGGEGRGVGLFIPRINYASGRRGLFEALAYIVVYIRETCYFSLVCTSRKVVKFLK